MLPPPAREKTRLSRVIAAIIFAFAFPPFALAVFPVALRPPNDSEQILAVLAALPTMFAMSLLVGWIFVLPACAAWAILHQFDRHYRLAAALVGFATGLAFGSLLAAFGDDGAQVVEMPLMEMLLTGAMPGLLTGLGVWWIAYGRQHRLPKPILTRPQLSL